jgi:hypothetical protein
MTQVPAVGRRGFMAATAGAAATMGTPPASGAVIDPALQAADGTVPALVRLDGPSGSPEDGTAAGETVRALKHAAGRQQRGLRAAIEGISGVELARTFWVANAALVTVDTGADALATLAALPAVERIHRTGGDMGGNRDQLGDATGQASDERAVSYGLEMMHVPELWERFGTRGEGATIAVIDTGVDPDHPDIDLAGWAEFDAAGERVDSDPYDPVGHGTGMSSLATGGDASGTQIGVAPDAELLVARHSKDDFLVSSLAGIEWAIEQGADAISMSFDAGPLKTEMVEALENAVAAGSVPVPAALGDGFFLTPGSVYTALNAGAIDRDRVPYNGGNGGEIRTDRYWRDKAVPDAWPDRYTVPKVVTAGVDVLGAVPDNDRYDGGHMRMDGYSNAPPHVSGVVALLRALDGDVSTGAIEQAIRERAVQPGKPVDQPDPNGDFGHGVVNAVAAAADVVGRERTVSGTVVDPDGAPVETATVQARTGDSTTTDASGRFELAVPAGQATLTARATGYEPVTRQLAPGKGQEIAFETERRPVVERVERSPTRLAPGASATVEVAVANAEFMTVFVRESPASIGADPVSLRVAGNAATLDEPTAIDPEAHTLRIDVTVDAAARGTLQLGISVAAGEATDSIELAPIHVHADPLRLTGEDDIQAAIAQAAPETTVELAGDTWTLDPQPTNSPLPESRYQTPVFESTREDRAGLLIETPVELVAADGATPTLELADAGGGERTFGIQITPHFTTVEGIEVNAPGATAAISVLDGDGVHLEGVTVAGGATGVLAQFTKSLVVRNTTIDATDTAIALQEFSLNALLEGNTLRNAELGVFLSGRIGERLFDVDATVTDTTYDGVKTELDTEGTATVRDGSGATKVTGDEAPEDSPLDLLLYGSAATLLAVLLYPFGKGKFR